MLNNTGFDLWANDYDKDVQLTEESNEYPFAGYKAVLGTIHQTITRSSGRRVLELGFGTGILAKKLYDSGYIITGVDFSQAMIDIAQTKMPAARLIRYDFAAGLPECLRGETFDFVVCTYAIHHLTDAQKIDLLRELNGMLSPRGCILIGDVAFARNDELAACRASCGDDWDDDEIYPTAENLLPVFPHLQFQQISYCAGVITISRDERTNPNLREAQFI